MTGYADTDLFGPSDELTRAQFVTVLHRIVDPEAAGVDFTTVKNETGFVDVEDGKFYTTAANWAVANKIITGVNGVDVDGTRYIQAGTILSRAMAAQVIANSCYNDLL